MRHIVLKSGVWSYEVGSQNVKFKDPTGVGFYVPAHEIIGTTVAAYEKGQWKGTSDGAVTPGLISQYLEQRLANRAK